MANGNGMRGQDLTQLPRSMHPRDMEEHEATDYMAVDFAIPAERTRVSLEKLAAEIQGMPLDRIAEMVRALTYGEMIEAAEAIGTLFRAKGIDASEQIVAGILHDWSKQRVRQA